jgi:predicted nucleic acid-binding protein
VELSKRYLLDTNAVIYLVNGRLALPLRDGQYNVSIITEIELLSFADLSSAEEQKIHDILKLLNRVGLTDAVRDETIRLRRKNRLKLHDAIIAASALHQDAVLLTNDQAFASIDGLRIESLQLSQNRFKP